MIALLVFSAAGAVLPRSFSFAQQTQPEIRRKVVSRVVPAYPDLARRTNLRGAVKLLLVVAPDGAVNSTEVIGGNPVLAQAAVAAAHKWKFEAAPQQTKEVVELKFDTH